MSESILHWAYLFILRLTLFILFHCIVLMVGCGTYTLIHIDDIRHIREVEDGNFIGIYLSLRKCKTPMYKLILNYAHMYATCSSRVACRTLHCCTVSLWSILWFWNFYMESIEIMTLNFQVSKYYQLIQIRDNS